MSYPADPALISVGMAHGPPSALSPSLHWLEMNWKSSLTAMFRL